LFPGKLDEVEEINIAQLRICVIGSLQLFRGGQGLIIMKQLADVYMDEK